ncbi:MAG: hypothetical protein DLM55_02410 [Acidimicrobiales bacterium]|nr:MAG: hypothetical protein DLM55_02410 [Acidimicrobiales bacterium]
MTKAVRDNARESSDPWVLVAVHAIGGLTELGFLPDSRRLLIVSHQGRGEYDVFTGARVARDRSENRSDWFDEDNRACLALTPGQPTWIPVSGLAGGALPTTYGEWSLSVTQECAAVVKAGGLERMLLCSGEEVRVVGFSPDGRTIVVGRPMDVYIYRAGHGGINRSGSGAGAFFHEASRSEA